jgi:hypothetical protein
MKNIWKGYITSIVGLIIMVADALYFFGAVDFPSPDFTPQAIELGIAFLAGLILFVMPATKLEEYLSRLINKKIDKE